jgi:hypothetical protein
MFLDSDPPAELAMVFLLEEQTQVEDEWIADGHRVDFHGWPGQRKFYCYGIKAGKHTSRLTPHSIGRDGQLKPFKGDAVSEQL